MSVTTMADLPDTLRIHNGDKVQPTFTVAEFARRIEKLRVYMAEQGVDSVLFTSYHSINYYSDFIFC